jgi:hypothetical protein
MNIQYKNGYQMTGKEQYDECEFNPPGKIGQIG